jgi:hypothetical protein
MVDIERFKELYFKHNKSVYAIAKIFNLKPKLLYKRMKKLGIKLRESPIKKLGLKYKNIKGRRFGRWVVLKRKLVKNRYRYLCRCDCGTIRWVSITHLIKGLSKSCGCLQSEKIILSNKNRRMTGKYKDKYGLCTSRRYKLNRLLVSRYGITLEEYNNLLISQNRKCKICGKSKKLTIDHCHNTKKVRGLLCYRCNLIVASYENFRKVFPLVKKYLNRRN